jgi:3-oxoadipate enol-lactonase/4-carboxymuconolactone decarboxylase
MKVTPALTRLAGREGEGDLLIVGAGLGTAAATLWGAAATLLGERFEVVGVDLPGHGRAVPATGAFRVADLAAGLREAAGAIGAGRRVWYAGVSLAGAVAFELARDPGPFAGLAALASASTLGDATGWHDRASLVRRAGTPVLVSASAQRWFAPGFTERDGAVVGVMLHDLRDTDDESYARCCEALAAYDARDVVLGSSVPFLLGPGELDEVVTPARAEEDRRDGVTLHVFSGCAHQPPAEDPAEVARVLSSWISSARPPQDRHAAGMRVRREVLGDEHVDRAVSRTTPFTADFQRFITETAWGSVWTRPGLDRRTRSVVTLTALIAHGHWGELAMHVVAARRNGLTEAEIAEVILQSAVYCGVPAANHAFAVAQQELAALAALEEGSS